jgi:hypothetical protein
MQPATAGADGPIVVSAAMRLVMVALVLGVLYFGLAPQPLLNAHAAPAVAAAVVR